MSGLEGQFAERLQVETMRLEVQAGRINDSTERMRTEVDEKISGIYKSINELKIAIETLKSQ